MCGPLFFSDGFGILKPRVWTQSSYAHTLGTLLSLLTFLGSLYVIALTELGVRNRIQPLSCASLFAFTRVLTAARHGKRLTIRITWLIYNSHIRSMKTSLSISIFV